MLQQRRYFQLSLALLTLAKLVKSDALDFSLYPTNSQACLYAAAKASDCDTSTVPVFNACVCSNGGGFLQAAASCLGSSDSSEVTIVFETMSTNCGNSNTPISYSADKWASVAAGGAASSTAAPSSSASISSTWSQTTYQSTMANGAVTTVTVTQSPSSSASQTTQTTSSTGTAASQTSTGTGTPTPAPIGTGALAGIVIGGAAVLGVAAFAIFFFLRRHRANQNSRPEAAPFIGTGYGGGGGGGGGDENKAYYEMNPLANMPPPTEPYDPTKYGQHAYPSVAYGQSPYDGHGYGYHGGVPSGQHGPVELSGQPAPLHYAHELPTG